MGPELKCASCLSTDVGSGAGRRSCPGADGMAGSGVVPESVAAQIGRAINLLQGTSLYLQNQSDPAKQDRGRRLAEVARKLRDNLRSGRFFLAYRHERPVPWRPRTGMAAIGRGDLRRQKRR